jgi:hypothetical protein
MYTLKKTNGVYTVTVKGKYDVRIVFTQFRHALEFIANRKEIRK